jgi:hypothetical protein
LRDRCLTPADSGVGQYRRAYCEGKELLLEVVRRFEVVGVDFVEVSPPYAPLESDLCSRREPALISSGRSFRAHETAPSIVATWRMKIAFRLAPPRGGAGTMKCCLLSNKLGVSNE